MKQRVAATVPVVVAGGLLVHLGRAFLADDFSLRIVAEQSHAGAPWFERLSGLWASAEGSLLLFTAVVAAVGWAGTRGRGRPGGAVGASVLGLLVVLRAVAWPFERLDVPATGGLGITPILDHPAMMIHPPVLYAGFAAALVPFARAVGGTGPARRWLLASFALLTAAMALGAWWSYAEQGWGGYWAWDPVENGSLLVWLTVLLALHAPAAGAPTRRRAVIDGAPWVVALAVSAASRSGAVPSVHAFADASAVGWSLTAAAAGSAVVLVAAVVRGPTGAAPAAGPAAGTVGALVGVQQALVAGAAAVVAGGIAVPFGAELLGTGPVGVTGRFYAPLLATMAVAAVVALAWLAARPGGRTAAAWVAHAGFVLVVAGSLASTADHVAEATIVPGAPIELLGARVANEGVVVEPGERPGSQVVRARLVVDGTVLTPALVSFPERGGVLSETDRRLGWWRDLRVSLVRADDRGRVLVEVRSRPGMNLVWAGAASMAAGSVVRGRGRGRRPRPGRPVEPASAPAAH